MNNPRDIEKNRTRGWRAYHAGESLDRNPNGAWRNGWLSAQLKDKADKAREQERRCRRT